MTRLGVDFGTSNTVAVLQAAERSPRPLLFDGSPQLPSAVFADPAGGLLTGRDALHHARTHPERFAAHPKRDIDDIALLLGDAEPEVPDVIAAVLRRVRDEAARVAGAGAAELVLTHPAAWGPRRRAVLVEAARRAGLPVPALVSEPVAAAAYFVGVLGARVPVGDCVVVYDFGAGTFDASVVRRTPAGFLVLASVGLPDAGGLDIDAAVVTHLLAAHPEWDPQLRQRLDRPVTPEDRRARMLLWEDARAAKEMLSRTASTFIHVPLLGLDLTLSRDLLEQLARPVIDRTVTATNAAIRDAGIAAEEISGVFLVGGSSRIPLAATLLHRRLGIAPTVLDQPELVVAEGAVRALPASRPDPPASVPQAPVSATQPRPVATVYRATGRRRRRAWIVGALTALLVAAGAGVGYATWPAPHNRPAQAGPESGQPQAGSSAPAPVPSAVASAAPSTFPADYVGTWTGNVTQSVNNSSIPVEIRILPDATVGAVRYPGPPCAGTLAIVSGSAGELKLREQITSGSCTKQGTITLTGSTAAGRILFTYVPDNANYSVGGPLTRK